MGGQKRTFFNTVLQDYIALEGNTLIQIQKCCDNILSAFFQSLPTNKIWSPYKKLKSEHPNISKFILPPDTYSKYSTAKENFEAFSRALIVNSVKDTTIYSSKSPKSHVKLVTYMHRDNRFDLLIAVVFAMSPKLGGLGPKSQELVIPFYLDEVETISYLRLRALTIRSGLDFIQYQTGKINDLTGKYIVEL